MSKVKKIVLTGGGTAGHVTPNIALLPELKKQGYDVHYIGSYEGIERTLIKEQGIPYYGISSGKLRRYIDVKNLSDPFKVVKGLGQAIRLLGRSRMLCFPKVDLCLYLSCWQQSFVTFPA